MSVKKFRVSKHGLSFTTIPNSVIRGLAYDTCLLGLYVYLSSLAEGWEFHKNHLRDTCNIGINKLDNMIKKLSDHGLVNIIQIRNEKGQFSFFDMQVNDGTGFKVINSVDNSHRSMKTVPTVTVPRKTAPINKRHTNEIKINKRESTVRIKREPLSDDFVFNDENQKLCQSKNLDPVLVLNKFKAHSKAVAKQCVDWQAEAKLWITRERPSLTEPVKKEMYSNVLEWGPGHPTWEANKQWKNKQTKEVKTHGCGQIGDQSW